MITKEQAVEMCKQTRLQDTDMLLVIQRYIYDKKGVTVKINRPNNLVDAQLMNIAFESSCNYYLVN
jgi:hypothetical protein